MSDKDKVRKGSSRSRNSKNRKYDTRKKNSNSSGHLKNKRTSKKSKRNKSIAGIILLLAVCILVMLALARKSLSHNMGIGKENESSSQIKIFDENNISYDLYIDVSGVFPGKEDLLNVKGMNRDSLRKYFEGLYNWNVIVKNANPSIAEFVMPDIIKETEGKDADVCADAQGTVQEVKVSDKYSNITISPSKKEFKVPDLMDKYLDSYVDNIFMFYKENFDENGRIIKSTESTEEDTKDTDESTLVEADCVLARPDFSEKINDYLKQLAIIWDMNPINGEIVSFDAKSGKFIFGDNIKGYRINAEKTASDLLKKLSSDGYDFSIETSGESVDTSENSIRSKYKIIGKYVTHTTGNAVRNKNIALSLKAINGHIVKPGEEFSFNETVGKRTEKKGYGAAGAYSGGVVVKEVGGGVCQASTTLFNAIYRSGLTTTYRRSHTFKPSYVSPGFDATVSWGGPDYRFVNSSKHNIGIMANYSNQTCTVSIYGVPVLDNDVTLDLASVKVRDFPDGGSEWKVYKIMKQKGKADEKIYDHTVKYKGHKKPEPESTEESEESSEGEELESVSESETMEILEPGDIVESKKNDGSVAVDNGKNPSKNDEKHDELGPSDIKTAPTETKSAPSETKESQVETKAKPSEIETIPIENDGPGILDTVSSPDEEGGGPNAGDFPEFN